jgi:LPS export ABC transporter protein LptC
MVVKNLFKNKNNIALIILLFVIVGSCLWAFIYAGMITKSFKNKIIDKSFNNKEANIESLLVTETKDGQKLWELFADEGNYTDSNNIVLLQHLIGNVYDGDIVKASFKADEGTYNATKKQIILYNNVLLVYLDGTNVSAERIVYSGKDEDIIAEGNVRIEKPNEAVIMGNKAVLSSNYSDFHIQGRTQTQFYM